MTRDQRINQPTSVRPIAGRGRSRSVFEIVARGPFARFVGVLTCTSGRDELSLPLREESLLAADGSGAVAIPLDVDARLTIVFVVFATKKVLDRCGGLTAVGGLSTTTLGDWYATALFWRPHVALFVNERTRLPVFVSLAPAKTLVSRFVTHLAVVLAVHGVDPRFIGSELAHMTEHRLAKTANRSVVGTMTEFSFLAEAARAHDGVDDLLALSLRLAGTPCGPLRDGYGFPDRELTALVERIPGIG